MLGQEVIMKTPTAAIGLILLAATNTGCVSYNLDKVVTAMANDTATVHVKISSVYGIVEVARTNPHTNSLPHSVGPDGTINIKP